MANTLLHITYFICYTIVIPCLAHPARSLIAI